MKTLSKFMETYTSVALLDIELYGRKENITVTIFRATPMITGTNTIED